MRLEDRLYAALDKLAKWRLVFAGWQLGTRTIEDPESQAVRDHREVTMMLLAEANAFTRLLVEKGVCTHEEFQQALLEEAEALDANYERKFPGMKSTPDGIHYDVQVAAQTMRGWRP